MNEGQFKKEGDNVEFWEMRESGRKAEGVLPQKTWSATPQRPELGVRDHLWYLREQGPRTGEHCGGKKTTRRVHSTQTCPPPVAAQRGPDPHWAEPRRLWKTSCVQSWGEGSPVITVGNDW